MPQTPINIFISYAHADSPFVDRLQADLQQQGFVVWGDRSDLSGGQKWRRELQEAVDRSHVLLVVLSPDAVASECVQNEYSYASDEGKLIIPLYYRPCKVPLELRGIQWIDLQHSYEEGLIALLRALHRQDNTSPTPSSSTGNSQPDSLAEPVALKEPEAMAPPPASNLPAQLTPLIGRQHEIEAVSRLLRQSEVRLVTLSGPGGIGKTRLALQVATELAKHFADGVFLVPLAAVSAAEQVVPAILQTLVISEQSGQASLSRLKAVLKDKQLLVLLDNFEQVLSAAVQLAELLSGCPTLKLLVTSQVLLHVQAEHEFAVPPLSLPDPKRLPDLSTLAQYEAVALFLARVQVVKPDFALTAANAAAVASICTRLDGLPLTIELAAARVKFFTPQALLARLEQGLAVLVGGARDLPSRQQTLRGAIAWSYGLLSPEEQTLFRRLCVFVDGCSLQAADMVCQAAGPLELDLLEGLLSLVDKSLLRQKESAEGELRFWMLQVLREFCWERLVEAGESEATRQGHGQYYLWLAQQAEAHLTGTEQASWMAQLEQDYENLRTSLRFLLERASQQTGSPQAEQANEQGLLQALALQPFWRTHHEYVREGLAFLQQALGQREALGAALQARALYAVAELAFALGDYDYVESQLAESLALYGQLKDKAGYANCLFLLGTTDRVRNQYGQARNGLQEAVHLFEERGDRWKRGQCMTELARIATEVGQYERARTLLSESLQLYSALNDQHRLGWVRYLLARLLFVSQLDPLRAQQLAEQSLMDFRELGSTVFSTYPLGLLGWMQLVQEDLVAARPLLEECLELHKEVREGGDDSDSRLALAQLLALQGEPAAAHHLYQHNLALLWEQWQGVYKEYIARSLAALAALEASEGAPAKAARWWGTAEALREAIGVRLYPVDRPDYEQAVAATRREMGEQAFAAVWEEGRALPLEQVIDDVLKMSDEAGKQ